MPIATVAALMVVAPSYLRSMADDPTGRYLIFGAIVAQFLGYYFIRKIIDIKV
jgi:Flp pilus assembly protein TadB